MFRCRAFGKHFRFAARKRGAFVKQRIDLAIELSDAPATPQRFHLVKLPRLFAGDGEQSDTCRPGKRKRAATFRTTNSPDGSDFSCEKILSTLSRQLPGRILLTVS